MEFQGPPLPQFHFEGSADLEKPPKHRRKPPKSVLHCRLHLRRVRHRGDGLAAHVGGHDDDGVLEVHRPALGATIYSNCFWVSCRPSTKNGGIYHRKPGFPKNTLKKAGILSRGYHPKLGLNMGDAPKTPKWDSIGVDPRPNQFAWLF